MFEIFWIEISWVKICCMFFYSKNFKHLPLALYMDPTPRGIFWHRTLVLHEVRWGRHDEKNWGPLSKCKCERGWVLQKWIAVIYTPKTDAHRIDAICLQVMTFYFCWFDPRWHLHFDIEVPHEKQEQYSMDLFPSRRFLNSPKGSYPVIASYPYSQRLLFFNVVNVVVVLVKKYSSNWLKMSDYVSDIYVMTKQIFKIF